MWPTVASGLVVTQQNTRFVAWSIFYGFFKFNTCLRTLPLRNVSLVTKNKNLTVNEAREKHDPESAVRKNNGFFLTVPAPYILKMALTGLQEVVNV